jgi:hypothetical protein
MHNLTERWCPIGMWSAALCALIASAGCSATSPSPSFIEPAFGSPCQSFDCSNHGTCTAAASATPACTCDAGFAGAHCEHEVCGSGSHWDSSHRCVPDQSCAAQPSDPCGAHGICDDGTGVLLCQCDPGYDGPRCNLCVSGYGRNQFQECVVLTIAAGGAGGAASTAFSVGAAGSPAAGGGVRAPGDAGADAHADADAGADADADAGGPRCAAETCNHHGACDDSGGTPRCTCEPAFSGAHCDACASGFHDDDAGSATCTTDAQCSSTTCSGHGTCDASTGIVVCTCDSVHTGTACAACASGYHADGSGGCAANQRCQTGSCPTHATCADTTGVVVCSCTDGYTGSTCSTCASGIRLQSVGPIDFNSRLDFPTSVNNCLASLQSLSTNGMTLSSIDGDGTVWECGPSTIYGFGSLHVALEAGATHPALIVFDAPVASLSFDYAARLGPLSVQLSADGQALTTLSQINNGTGSLSFTFATPITRFAALSLSGSTSQIALDNISFELATCQP